MISMLEM